MSSTKLRRFSQRKSPLPNQAARIKEIREQLEALLEGDVIGQGARKLEGVSFQEYCASLRIKTTAGIQPFILFPWQVSFTDLLVGPNALKRRQISLLSSRQTGKTSVLLVLLCYLALSQQEFTAIVIHKTTADTHLLARRVKKFLGDTNLSTDSLGIIEFAETRSTIHFRSSNPGREDGAEQCGRGIESCDFVYVEEASHTRNLQDVIGVCAPTMTWSDRAQMVFVGTGSTKQSFFYESLAKAANGAEQLENTLSRIRQGTVAPYQLLGGDTGPIGIITNWRVIKRFRDEPDFLKRVKEEFNLSDEQIAAEYQLDFESSVDSACFDFALVMAASTEASGSAVNPEGLYYVGIDPSGKGADYSVCIILEKIIREEREHFRAVKMYRRKSGTAEQHLGIISDLIRDYDPISTTVEANGLGAIWLENLEGLGLNNEINSFNTSQRRKEKIIGRLQLALERGVLEIPKGPIIDELLAFRRTEKGKLEAGGKAHDDCVVALALALESANYS